MLSGSHKWNINNPVVAQIQFVQIRHVPKCVTWHHFYQVVGQVQHCQVMKHSHLYRPQVTENAVFVTCCFTMRSDERHLMLKQTQGHAKKGESGMKHVYWIQPLLQRNYLCERKGKIYDDPTYINLVMVFTLSWTPRTVTYDCL